MVSKCGQMAPNTKATGATTQLTAEANSTTLMEMFMMVNGKIMNLMDKVSTNLKMEISTRENGKMVKRMGKVFINM